MEDGEGLTIDEWRQSAQSDYSGDGPLYELLDGEIVETPAPTFEHADCIARLAELLEAAVGDRAVLSVQKPIHLDDRSEPRPDIVVLSPRAEGYDERLPVAEDILLVVEVSDEWISLGYDRGRKAAYYARCGIAECWVIDLTAGQVLLMRSPASGGYRDQRNIRRGARPLSLAALEDVSVDVDRILGG